MMYFYSGNVLTYFQTLWGHVSTLRKIVLSFFLLLTCFCYSSFGQVKYQFKGYLGPGLPLLSVGSTDIDSKNNIYAVRTLPYAHVLKFDPQGRLLSIIDSTNIPDHTFIHPKQIRIGKKGNLYVLDYKLQCIFKFDSTQKFLQKIMLLEQGDSHLRYLNMALDQQENIYLVSYNLPAYVAKFDSQGNLLMKFGSTGKEAGQFNVPGGLTVDLAGNIYVADDMNHRIQKFDSKGNFLIQFGSSGVGNDQFNKPHYIDVDADGNLYIVDYPSVPRVRVRKFDSQGHFIKQIGSAGDSIGQYQQIADIRLDNRGHIYVATIGGAISPYNPVWGGVQKYDVEGNFITKYGLDMYTQFEGPEDLATDADNNIYMVDRFNYQIDKFNTQGKILQSIEAPIRGRNGYGTGGIALDKEKNIYIISLYDITNYRENQIQKFSPEGELLTRIGVAQNDADMLRYPTNMAIDKAGNIFVVDQGKDRIAKFNSDGQILSYFGSTGSGDGQFRYPHGITLDAKENIYILENGEYGGNVRIQKFDPNGNFLLKFGSKGTGDGQFSFPSDLIVDKSGTILVVDRDKHCVQAFDSTGKFVTRFGSYGVQDGRLYSPIRLALDSTGNVYISESGNRRISIFYRDTTGPDVDTTVTGIDPSQIYADIVLYPNPSNGQFTIDYSKATIRVDRIDVINNLGQKVFTKSLPPYAGKQTSIDIPNLTPGLYTVLLTTSQSSFIKKLIIK
ncbi:T9SS type A sorting domain-containing protein [Cytophagaceae bacterium YF14B1]|uniref:T9SS type A sorting domain-containing protein n=1 Tax=Xanthocytophaga flava TaxID=3048013 RepID=A0AAE3U8S4_9BACT|nr:T9SS type A sorting domain-containing protein [Xanthocytophaga flavus]MDJ1484334.1 T9SS type A sorting domain-containing protein [Xanthocytophaga flavus]